MYITMPVILSLTTLYTASMQIVKICARKQLLSSQYFNIRSNSNASTDNTSCAIASKQTQVYSNTGSNATCSNVESLSTTTVFNAPDEVSNESSSSNEKSTLRTKTSSKSIVLFPGQGSQYVGMGEKLLDFPSTREKFNVASDILGYDLLNLCLKGPKEELNKTVHCQPAMLVASLAAVERLKAEDPQSVDNCIATAGFSVGEYAALVFARAISFETAVEIVKVRAEAMQTASEMIPSGMMTVVLAKDTRINHACVVAKDWCVKMGIKDPHCQVANYLSSWIKVIAGNNEALQFIEMNAGEFGIRRFKRLAVSGAFHTPLMLPAEPVLRKFLSKVEIKKPSISVYCNVDAHVYDSEEDIRKGLVTQISSPVRWEQIMTNLYKGKKNHALPKTYECGPGRSLKSILNTVNKKAFEVTENIEA